MNPEAEKEAAEAARWMELAGKEKARADRAEQSLREHFKANPHAVAGYTAADWKAKHDAKSERLRLVTAGARALALATSEPETKAELERLAKLAEKGGR